MLAVVDPGVGTGRRALALRTAADTGTEGVRAPAARRGWWGRTTVCSCRWPTAYGGIDSAVGIDRAVRHSVDRHRVVAGPGDPGPTFDGRDVFAPAAAHLVLGGDPALLGPALDPASLVTVGRAERPVPGGVPGGERAPSTGAVVLTSVASVDRFGNVQLEAGPAAWEEASVPSGAAATVTVLTGPVPAIRPARRPARDPWSTGPGPTGARPTPSSGRASWAC